MSALCQSGHQWLEVAVRVEPIGIDSDARVQRKSKAEGVFFRASTFNMRTCSDVHARRRPFRLAIISPSG
jgi:hypothetical protein